MANKKKQDLYTKAYWTFTALMLLTALPLGVVLIFVKLFERRRKRRAVIFRPVPEAPLGAQTTLRPDIRPVREALEEAAKAMRRRSGTGLILTILSASLLVICATNGIPLWTSGWCLFVSGCYMVTGVCTLSSVGRVRKYLSVMTNRPIMALSDLAEATGLHTKQIRQDFSNLEFMDLLSGAFLDLERDLVFCF